MNLIEQMEHDKALSLEHARIRALSKQDELQRRVASRSDEGYLELILMERLGLVPEGQIKVHFIP